jgi:hypothetical protein
MSTTLTTIFGGPRRSNVKTIGPCRRTRVREAVPWGRATGITAYLKNGGTLEKAAQMANHASTRTTQLYDRRREELSLDGAERIRV